MTAQRTPEVVDPWRDRPAVPEERITEDERRARVGLPPLSALPTKVVDFPDWRQDRRLLELTDRRAAIETRLAEIAELRRTAARIEETADGGRAARVAKLLGDRGRSMAADARQRQIDAAHADAAAAKAERVSLVAERDDVDQAIAIARTDARAAGEARVREAYRAAVERLDRALTAASAANEVLIQIKVASVDQGIRLPDDLGWIELATRGQAAYAGAWPNETHLERWRKVAGPLLERKAR